MHDVEVEQILIGAALMNNELFHAISGVVSASHFYEPLHVTTWEIMTALIGGGKLANPRTVKEFMPDGLLIGEMTAPIYLARLAAAACTASEAPHMAAMIRDLADRRAIIGVAEELSRAKPMDVSELASWGVDELDKIVADRTIGQVPALSLGASLVRAVDSIAKAYQSDGALTGMALGLKDLDRKTSGLAKGELTILAGRPGQGKEQPVDTPILTPLGWRSIGDIQPDDMVYGQNGKPVRVKSVHPQGVKAAYRVTFRDGTSTECGLDHLWSVSADGGRDRGYHVRSLRELIERGITRNKGPHRKGAKWRIPMPKPVEFHKKELPIDPYCLGVLIGDGCLSKESCFFSNPDFDSCIRIEFLRRMPDADLHANRFGPCPYYALRGVARKRVRTAVKAMGLNVKSLDKFIPDEYLFGSIEQRFDMLRGLMDTDGSCTKNRTSFSSHSRKLALDVCHLVRSLGGMAIFFERKRFSLGKMRDSFEINIRIGVCPFFNPRKAASWSSFKISKYIWAVEYSRDVEQVCISVDSSDGLYLTNDFIVTHNTLLALCFARCLCEAGHKGIFYSLEMGDISLSRRLLADMIFDQREISHFRMKSGKVSEDDFRAITDASERLSGLPLRIEQQSGLSISQISARARQMKRRGGLDFMVVDHMGHVQASDRYRGSKVNEVGEISSGLLRLARELDIAVIALAQLSRGVEGRDNKRPTLSDLRDSGNIEQDAATVLMVYRDAYYLQSAEPKPGTAEYDAWVMKMEACLHELEIIITKQRDGGTATVRAYVDVACNAVRDHGWTRDTFTLPQDDRFAF